MQFNSPNIQEEGRKQPSNAIPGASSDSNRPPTSEELDGKVTETQVKLAELKHAQDELERARAALEEARRRQLEFQNGREEIVRELVRGLGLLEERIFTSKREVEHMEKSLVALRESLEKVQSIKDEIWTKDNYNVELTRALTIIENARMEWNSNVLKWLFLSKSPEPEGDNIFRSTPKNAAVGFANLSFKDQVKLGFAMTLPLVVTGLAIIILLLILLFRR